MFYKGFNKDLQCTPGGKVFQYEVGKEYNENNAILCSNGFHACENPIDVFGYYPPSDSRYCEVELDDLSDKTDSDSKRCGKHIKIGAEIGIKGIVEGFIKFTFEKIDWENAKITNTGYRSAATNTGAHSAATNTGDRSAATNTGNQSAATNTGNQSAATNTGYQSAATNTGNQSAATNTGYRSAATNTGDQSAATNTGDRSAATNTGNQSAAIVEGKESIAITTGIEGKAKGSIGCWIVVTERGGWNGKTYPILCVKTAKVDGKKIKADTFYTLKNGKFAEVK